MNDTKEQAFKKAVECFEEINNDACIERTIDRFAVLDRVTGIRERFYYQVLKHGDICIVKAANGADMVRMWNASLGIFCEYSSHLGENSVGIPYELVAFTGTNYFELLDKHPKT